ncbi:MAG: glycosyltransferase family 2 protein [Cyclobacteriaceae bacterium]|nr:glycosyltransferase family 2 protein [Cyclobacteriaceae bacterium]
MKENPDISVVVPLFNEEESISELCDWIHKVLRTNGNSYEILLIDDGSEDNSWSIVQTLHTQDARVKGLRFNRNYGKSAALNMGFKKAKGKVVITMDADLQDSPEEIPALYQMIAGDGYDLVSGWKRKRHDPISKTLPSLFFNFVARKMSGIPLHDFNCGLKAYRQVVVKNIHVYGEMHRYIPMIAKWRGFRKIGEKVVQHQARKYGKTKFGLERFIYGFLDLISIMFVSKFRRKPMHFFGTLGTLSFFAGLSITIWLIGKKFYAMYHEIKVREIVEQPLFFLALVALIVGVQLFLAGFLAEMSTMHNEKDADYLVIETAGI